MAGKNKGGREVKKPKAEKAKNNMSQPSVKGVSDLSTKAAAKRPSGR